MSSTNQRAGIMAALALSMGATFKHTNKKRRGLGLDSVISPYRIRGVKRNLFEALKGRPMVLRSCDPSQHNTLRHEQVERRRKHRRRLNRKLYGRYRRATDPADQLP